MTKTQEILSRSWHVEGRALDQITGWLPIQVSLRVHDSLEVIALAKPLDRCIPRALFSRFNSSFFLTIRNNSQTLRATRVRKDFIALYDVR